MEKHFEYRSGSQPHIERNEKHRLTGINDLPPLISKPRRNRGLSLMMTTMIEPIPPQPNRVEMVVDPEEFDRIKKKIQKQFQQKFGHMIKRKPNPGLQNLLSKKQRKSSNKITSPREDEKTNFNSHRSSGLGEMVIQDSEYSPRMKVVDHNHSDERQVKIKEKYFPKMQLMKGPTNKLRSSTNINYFRKEQKMTKKTTPNICEMEHNSRNLPSSTTKSQIHKQTDSTMQNLNNLLGIKNSITADSSYAFIPGGKVENMNTEKSYRKRNLAVLATDQSFRINKTEMSVSNYLKSKKHQPQDQTQWTEELQSHFNQRKSQLMINSNYGNINISDDMDSCWDLQQMISGVSRGHKRSYTSMQSAIESTKFPFKLNKELISQQIKFKAPYAKNSATNINSIQNLLDDCASDYKQQTNISYAPSLAGKVNLISERSAEDSPYRLKSKFLEINTSKSPPIDQNQFLKLNKKYSSDKKSQTQDDTVSVDSYGKPKPRKLKRSDSSLEREKYQQMINIVNERIQAREAQHRKYKKSIRKLDVKEKGDDMAYLEDKIRKCLISNAPKFVKAKYQSQFGNLGPEPQQQVQKKKRMTRTRKQ